MINITTKFEPKYTPHFHNEISKLMKLAIDELNSIREIDFHKSMTIDLILTDNFWEELETQMKIFKVYSTPTKDKEYQAGIISFTDPDDQAHRIIVFNILNIPIISDNSEKLHSNWTYFLLNIMI